MSSAAYLVETVLIARITGSSVFTGVTVVHHERDTNTVGIVNRITVMVSPPTTYVPRYDGQSPPKIAESTVTVTAKTAAGQAVLDAWAAGLDAALPGNANNVRVLPATGGDWQTGASDQGEVVRTYTARYSYTD